MSGLKPNWEVTLDAAIAKVKGDHALSAATVRFSID